MKEKFCDENRQGRAAAYLLRCGKMPRRNQALVIALVIAGLLFAIVPVSAGSYSYDGVSLSDATHGTVQGTVVCDKGSNYGLKAPWFNTTFSVPGGSSVKWAKIYVSVWGGTENYVGWANGTITNATGTYTLTPSRIDKNAPGSNVIGSGNGKWIASHDVTSYLNPGQTFVANISTTGTIDKRVYDVTLVAVIVNSSSSKTAYWINDGNVNERYDAGYGELNNNITTFAAPSYNTTEAKVCLGQLVGTSGESDFAYLNVPDDADSPRDLTNIDWDMTTHRKYQIGTDDDLADSSQGNYFDLDEFTSTYDSTALKDLINLTGNNDVIFWRGHDYDSSGVIEGTWGASDSEGETYVTPFLAVLTLKDISRVYDFNSSTLGTAETDLYAYEGSVTARPPTSSTTPTTGISTSSALAADDGSYEQFSTSTAGQYAAQRFIFTLQSPDTTTSNLAKLTVTWNGKGYHGNTSLNGANLYIWNSNVGSYEELASTTTGADTTLSADITTNIGNYISSSTVTILAVQSNAQTGSGGSAKKSTIETDYMKLVIDPAV
jgi:hypothetical protein